MKVNEITAVFQCLMDETRLRTIKLLVSNQEKGVERICVGDFVLSLGELQYNVSKQLKILELSGVLISKKIGRNVYFSLAKGMLVEGLFQLISSLPDKQKVFASDLKRFSALDKTAAVKKPTKSVKRAKPTQEISDDSTVNELPSNLL